MARSLSLTTLSLLLATGLTPVALAQSPQSQGMMGPNGMMGWGTMGPGMWSNGMMGPGMRGMTGYGMMGPGMMMGYGPMMQGQLTYLKAELGITDAQKPAWDGYADAVQAHSSAMQAMHTTMMQAWQSGTALDRMDAHVQAMQTMLESMKAIRPATETLYNALSDDQKKKADLLLGNGCCMM